MDNKFNLIDFMQKNKKTVGIISIVVIFICFTGAYMIKGKDTLGNSFDDTIFEEETSNNEEIKENIEVKEEKILVDIKGEIKKPGVYELDKGSIVEDLIKLAGGITDKGTLDTINRAQELKKNEAILIPNKDELKEAKAFNNTSIKSNIDNSSENELININTADSDELNKINGIGKSKAEAIIKYREENGGFKSIEEIKNVSGIGDATFEKIKSSICT